MRKRALVAALLAASLLPWAGPAFAGPAPSASTNLRVAVKAALAKPADDFQNVYVREVWLKVMSERLAPFISDAAKRKHLLLLVHVEAKKAGVPPELVLSLIDVESDFDRWAVSATGAQGLMQIMPFWLKVAGKPGDNLFDAETNLRLGCTILAYYLKQSHGDIALALQGYYGSRDSNEYSSKVLRLLSTRWYWNG